MSQAEMSSNATAGSDSIRENIRQINANNAHPLGPGRDVLVKAIVFVWVITILVLFAALFMGGDTWNRMVPVSASLIPAELAILGSAVAFYMSKE